MEKKISLIRDNVNITKVGASKLLVEIIEGDEKLKSGIIIPGNTQEGKPVIGEVVRKGDAVTDYSIGDIVIFSHFSGCEMNLKMKTRVNEEVKEAKAFKLISDIDVWGTIEKVEE